MPSVICPVARSELHSFEAVANPKLLQNTQQAQKPQKAQKAYRNTEPMSYFQHTNKSLSSEGYAPFSASPQKPTKRVSNIRTLSSLNNAPDIDDDDRPSSSFPKEKFNSREALKSLWLQFKAFSQTRTFWILVAWFAVWWIFIRLEFGAVYFLVSCFVGVFINLGRRRMGEQSAYNVFNSNLKELPGTLNAKHFEDQLMMRTGSND